MKGLCAGVLLALLLPSGAVQGQPAASLLVRLELKDCEDLNEKEVRRAFLAEIGARLTDEVGPLVTLASAICEQGRVQLSVVDPITRKAVRRRIDLGPGTPRGRERLLALAMAELLVSSWAELEINPLPKVEPEGPAPSPEALQAARRVVQDQQPASSAIRPPPSAESPGKVETVTPGKPSAAETPPPEPPRSPKEYDFSKDRNFRILALGSIRAFIGQPGMLVGGGLRVGEERFRVVSWNLDSLVETGELGGGDYAVDSATFGGGVSFFWRTRSVTGRLGGGVRVGMVRSTISADEVRGDVSEVGLWGWPLLSTSGTVFSHGAAIELSAEGGYAFLPLSAGATAARDSSLRGTWFSVQLGFGFLP